VLNSIVASIAMIVHGFQEPTGSRPTPVGTSCSIQNPAQITVRLQGAYRGQHCRLAPDSLHLSGFFCTKCSFEFKSIVYDPQVRDARWIDSEIAAFPIDGGVIENVTIIDSHIRKLDATGVKLNHFVVFGGVIDTLILRGGTISDVRIHHSRIGYVEFRDVLAKDVTLEAHSGGEIVIAGGTWTGLRLSHHLGRPPSVRIELAEVVRPYIALEIADAVDLRRLGLGAASLVLEQEAQALDVEGTSRATAWWTEAQVVYGVFSRQLTGAGLGPVQRWMEYRMHFAELQSIDSDLYRWGATLWNVHLRGKFGLFPGHVLVVGLIVTVLFGFGYGLIGFLGFGWAGYTPVGLEGERIGQVSVSRPQTRNLSKLIAYGMHALFFSADRILFGGSRVFQFEHLLEGFRIEPRKYAAVGLGRFIGSLEGALGIVLLVNLVQAVLRTV